MSRPPFLLVLVAALLPWQAAAALPAPGPQSIAKAALPSGTGSLSGVWMRPQYKTSARFDPRAGMIRTVDGAAPPFQPWAAALIDQRIKDADAGHPFETSLSRCLPAGPPTMMLGPALLPIQILETQGQVTILFEELTNFRTVHLDRKHKDDPDPSFLGDSIGHWEGSTLVIDTIGFNDATTLDYLGTPHSDQMHLVERLRRLDQDTIEYLATIDDPKTFTRAWTARGLFKHDPTATEVNEDLCENNRNKPGGEIEGMTKPTQP